MNNLKKNKDLNTGQDNTSFANARRYFIFTILIIFSLLFFYGLIFKPKAPDRPFLIGSLQKEDIIKGINWYANNSTGSLQISDSEVCTLSVIDGEQNCSIIKTEKLKDAHAVILNKTIKNEFWPYIWYPGSPYSNNSFSFSFFKYKFNNKVIALKKQPSPLNDTTRLTLERKRIRISPFLESLISDFPDLFVIDKIEKLKEEVNKEEEVNILIKKHPMGYYLPVPALPTITQ